MNREQAIHAFYSQFLPAYDEQYIPEEKTVDGIKVKVEPPYITYPVIIGSYDSPIIVNPSIWYKSLSWEAITKKAMEIMDGIDGHTIKYDNGAILLNSTGTKYQRMNSGQDNIKRILLSIQMTFLER